MCVYVYDYISVSVFCDLWRIQSQMIFVHSSNTRSHARTLARTHFNNCSMTELIYVFILTGTFSLGNEENEDTKHNKETKTTATMTTRRRKIKTKIQLTNLFDFTNQVYSLLGASGRVWESNIKFVKENTYFLVSCAGIQFSVYGRNIFGVSLFFLFSFYDASYYFRNEIFRLRFCPICLHWNQIYIIIKYAYKLFGTANIPNWENFISTHFLSISFFLLRVNPGFIIPYYTITRTILLSYVFAVCVWKLKLNRLNEWKWEFLLGRKCDFGYFWVEKLTEFDRKTKYLLQQQKITEFSILGIHSSAAVQCLYFFGWKLFGF